MGPRAWGIRLQAVLTVVLALAALGALLVNAYATLGLPQRELEVRDQLRATVVTLAAAATPLATDTDQRFEDLDSRLRAVTERLLAAHPGVEGGFYVAGADRFGGYAYPSAPTGDATRSPRQEPPPLETPYIRLQAGESRALPTGEAACRARDIETSRVVVATAPVGTDRPAALVAWAMFRLTGPRDMAQQVRRFRLSVGLALSGLGLALILTFHLGRTLRRQRGEQERLREELRRSEHLAALGKLLAGVAHEVRNPLAGIRSTVQLWQRVPETARDPAGVAVVLRAVDRLDALVRRLLYFTRADRDERRPLGVNALLGETLDLLAAQAAGQSVTVKREFAPDLPAVCAAPGPLHQVFLNLACNALQAMPQGGTLSCRTAADAPAGEIEVSFTDTGPGFPPEVLAHLFEPFVTGRAEGSGLGLAICREIITQHGGRIEVESPKGRGATVCVRLPAGRRP